MKDVLAGIIIAILWLIIIHNINNKDEYKNGYADGYQNRINYEHGK